SRLHKLDASSNKGQPRRGVVRFTPAERTLRAPGGRIRFQTWRIFSGREGLLDGGDDLVRLRLDLGREAHRDRAVGRDQELLEVPADVAGVAAGVGRADQAPVE